jgi:hypothetical protein
MNTIVLKQDGWMLHEGKIVENEPIMFLSFRIELEEGYSLRSFFHMLEKYPLLMKMNVFFPSFIHEYQKCSESDCVFPGMDFLEFSKTVEMIGFPGKPWLEVFNSFYGMCNMQPQELKTYRLENLLDIPIRLGRLKHIVFGDKIDIFEFDTVFNLFEFVDGISWELSFHGSSGECTLRR